MAAGTGSRLRALAWALVAWVLVFVLAVSHPGRWPALVFAAGVFLSAAVWVIQAAAVRWTWVMLPLGAAGLWGFGELLAGTTVDRQRTLAAALLWAADATLFFLALQLFAFGGMRRRLRQALIAFGFTLSVVSVVQLFTSGGKIFWVFPTPYKELVLGPFVSPDHYAAFVELVLPLALFEMLRSARGGWAYGVMAGALFASVIPGGSRAGSALVAGETVVLLALAAIERKRAGKPAARLVLGVAASAVVFTLVTGWSFLWLRFQDRDPYRFRREMLASTLEMIRERPWTGFGLGTFETVYPAHAQFDDGVNVPHAHNDWAEWAAEGGLPFAALLLAIAIWTVRQALSAPWLIGVLAVFTHSLVDFPLQKPALMAWACLLLGAAAARRPPITAVGGAEPIH